MSASGRKAEARAGYLFASPYFIGFFVFMLGPVVAALYYSFCDYSVLKAPIWIGLDNYKELFGDEVFGQALANTFVFALFSIPLVTFTAIGLALLLNAKVRGQAFYRTFFYLPSLVPTVPMSVLWLWLFNQDFGIFNKILAAVQWPITQIFHRAPFTPNWLGDPAFTKPALVVMSVWGVGNAMVIYLAGLQEVPVQLYEACDLDGATPWQRTKHVTIPLLSPVILFNVIMAVIGSIQTFSQVYIMFPGGNPNRSVYLITLYLYDNAFAYQRMGYASAIGWVMFIIIMFLTLAAIKFTEGKVHYEGD